MRFRSALFLSLVLPGFLRAASAPAPLPVEPSAWDDRFLRLPPLYWYEREADRRFLMVSLLYWDWRDRDGAQKLLFPLFYSGREDDRALLLSLPFLASYRRGAERWTVAGPFFRSRSPRFTQTLLFPLYWQRSRPEGGRATTFLPFVFYDYRSRDRSKIDQAWPLGFRRVRGTESRGFLLNYLWARNSDEGFRTLFPAYWHTHSTEGSMDVAGPFYRGRRLASEGERRFAGVFPLAGGGGSAGPEGVRHGYVFPFFFHRRSPDHRQLLTLPYSREAIADRRRGHALLYYYDVDPSAAGRGVFPLWYRGASRDGFFETTQAANFFDRREGDERFQTLFPLYGYWRTVEGARFLSWGVWRRRTEILTAEGRSLGTGVSGWALLYHWSGDSQGNAARVLFPLYWRYRRPPDWRMDLAFPFYLHYRDGPLSLTATPLFIHSRSADREAWSWLFLYWRGGAGEKKADLLFPLYYRERSPRRRTLATPLLWTRRSALSSEGALPLAYWYSSAEKTRRFVLPVYGHARSADSQWTVLGLGYHTRNRRGRAYGLFPLWGRSFSDRETGSYVLPFYWASGDGRGNGSLALPLLLTHASQSRIGTPERERTVSYLLLGNVQQRGPDLAHGFFPLYQYERSGAGRKFWAPRVVPLVAWDRRPGERLTYVFPYAGRRAPGVDWDFVFPLWYRSARYDLSAGSAPIRGALADESRAFFPLYWSGRNPERTYVFAPPLYGRFDENRASAAPDGTERRPRRFRAVTPLGWSFDTGAGGKFRLFFPVYWRVATAPRPDRPARDIRVYGPWFTVASDGLAGATRTVGLAPLFSASRSENGDRSFDLLGGLYGREARGGRVRHRFCYVFTTAPRWKAQGQK